MTLGSTPYYHGQSIDLTQVAAVALGKGVPVFLIDAYGSDYGQPGSDWKPAVMECRDRHAAGLFQMYVAEKLGGQTKGCLVLFGNSHFTGTNPRWQDQQACLTDHLNLDYVLFNYDEWQPTTTKWQHVELR